jgi:hypothetical protein
MDPVITGSTPKTCVVVYWTFWVCIACSFARRAEATCLTSLLTRVAARFFEVAAFSPGAFGVTFFFVATPLTSSV